MNVPFFVNVYVFFPPLFVIVILLFDVRVAITFLFVGCVVLYLISTLDVSVVILLTTAFAVPLFPALSTNSNVNIPFFVNVYVFFPPLFVILISSLASNNVATTFLFVGCVVEYFTFAVGAVLSIFLTVAVVFPLFPSSSTNSNVNVPFFVNV